MTTDDVTDHVFTDTARLLAEVQFKSKTSPTRGPYFYIIYFSVCRYFYSVLYL